MSLGTVNSVTFNDRVLDSMFMFASQEEMER